jgi:SpoVK/Ycf46/Vps4 family AAA+-type ATPase
LIETRAREIFDLLGRLNHTVVFFDECDELFRDREHSPEAFRNVLSFVTASMLPKLQQLHDQRRIVFVLATNYLSRVDKAVRRPGRFDHVLLFDRPDSHARRLILRHASRTLREVSALKVAVSSTAGLTTKEILDGVSRKRWDGGTRSDYEEWCGSVAPAEVDASRYPLVLRAKLKAKWAVFARRVPSAARTN